MNSVNNRRLKSSLVSQEEDLLVRNIVLSHDPDVSHAPDGRRINSLAVLRTMENVMFYATMSRVSDLSLEAMAVDKLYNDEEVSSHEAFGQIIQSISTELLCKCSGERNLHMRTMAMFDLLRNFSWDAKVVLVLAAFATSYGEFWLLIQLYPLNELAVSVAMLKQVPSNLVALKSRFKALSLLVKIMVETTKCIFELEGLRLQHINLDEEAMFVRNSQIYVAAYWVIRSALTCSSLITDLIPKNYENSISTTIATWELSSLGLKLSSICDRLRKQVDIGRLQIEDRVQENLLHLFTETHMDNQRVLRILFSLKDDMPLKNGSSQAKLGVQELKNKVVVLLISKPDIIPLEELLFLVQRMCAPHHDESDRSYSVLWVPISSSNMWNGTELESYNHLSNVLPWYSIRQPWLLSSAVVNYIQQVWHFVDEPLMVVLDPQGRVTSFNAIHMVFIWGSMAYPFSSLREEQLWEEVDWSLGIIVDEIDPLLSMQVEEGRTICLYGSKDIEWIRDFTCKIKEITSTGVQLKLVYIGDSKPDENVDNIVTTIAQEKLSDYLSITNIHFFWLRLESIRKSKLQLGRAIDADRVLKEVSFLMSHVPGDNGWVIVGKGSTGDVLQYRGGEVMERLKPFPVWGENIGKLGFIGAMRSAFEPHHVVKPCSQYSVAPYVEGSTEGIEVCEQCKHPRQKFIVYQCEGTE